MTELRQSIEAVEARVKLARTEGRVARSMLRAGGADEHARQATSDLGWALEQVGVDGVCEAGVELVRLQLQLREQDHARQVALSLRRRFGPLRSAATCLGQLDEVSPHELENDVQADSVVRWFAERSTPGGAQLTSVDVYGAGNGARQVRIVLGFDGIVPYRQWAEPGPTPATRTVRIFLPGAALGKGVAEPGEVESGGVRAVRLHSRSGPSEVELVLVLDDKAEHRLFFLPSPYRMVLDVVAPPDLLADTSVSKPAASGRGGYGRRIVLDPGHGGHNPGAAGPTGLRESDVALDLARRVRELLEKTDPTLQVFLTRDGDFEVPLEQRAAIANAVGADVFVSLHLNSSASPTDPGGVTTFVLDAALDGDSSLAARENGTSRAAVAELSAILAALSRTARREQSLGLARLVHRQTLHRGRTFRPRLRDRGVRRAPFYVLLGVLAPALLLEASFISRPDEEAALREDEYRALLARGIAEGVLAYLADQS